MLPHLTLLLPSSVRGAQTKHSPREGLQLEQEEQSSENGLHWLNTIGSHPPEQEGSWYGLGLA